MSRRRLTSEEFDEWFSRVLAATEPPVREPVMVDMELLRVIWQERREQLRQQERLQARVEEGQPHQAREAVDLTGPGESDEQASTGSAETQPYAAAST
ncbi:hypothetical protein WJX72_002568 [[Myrmecia] bisecta]|uniref:Uncharacterized protein n=1 Tax=[Myrmecia] bisecta TaxID=41462 RepID=A0AAW1PP32_9CHLO